METPERSLRDLFGDVLEIQGASERAAFLDRVCGKDTPLRRDIEELIRAEAAAGEFLSPQADANRVSEIGLDLVGRFGACAGPAPPLLTEELGGWIGRYKLLQKIGEGGCGAVYMAAQEVPVRRRVALKVIKLGMDTKSVVGRFEAERQALALMDHPNIAKVLDAGATETGRPFFVMELVRGLKITRYCDEQRLSTHQRLELFVRVCHAVQHAHQKGIIHRDLKPSNILVTERDGQPFPKVIDFGIAKATGNLQLTDKTVFTAFEQFVGTPAYMSPEQARLGELDIDTRSDIYSLGVLLYELLTGTTPFDTKTLLACGLDELRRTIVDKTPVKPSTRLSGVTGSELTTAALCRGTEPGKLVKLLRGDLDWIVLKCLEKERGRRYETANHLASDVQRHINHEPVLARPPSRIYEFQKTVRRHKLGFGAALTVAAALAIGVAGSTWEAVQKERERQRFRSNVVRQYVANGTRLVNQGDLFGSLLWYAEALHFDAGDPRREQPHRIRIASVLRQCPKLVNVFSHGTMLYHAEFSPDGSKVLTTSDDKTAILWDARTGKRLHVFRHDGEVYRGSFSPDGLRIVTSSQDRTACVWDTQTGALVSRLRHADTVWWSCFSPDGKFVATGCQDGTAQLWVAATGEKLGAPLQHESSVENLSFSPDGRLLGSVTGRGTARVWELAGHTERFRGTNRGGAFSSLEFDSKNRSFLTVDGSNIDVRDAHTFERLAYSPLPFPRIHCAHFGPDGRTIVATSDQFLAQAWDAASGKPLFARPVEHKGRVLNAAVSPEGRFFVTAGQDTIGQVWKTSTGEPVCAPLKFILHVKTLEFNADGRRLLGNSCDQAARVWDLAISDSPGPAAPEFVNEHRITSRDGQYILLAGESNTVWIADTRTKQMLAALHHTNPVTYVSFSRDDKAVITASQKHNAVSSMANDIFLWDVPGGQRRNLASMRQAFAVLYVAFSPDNQRMLTCGFDFTARLWDVRTGQPLSEPLRHRDAVFWGAFSPDGRSVVTASVDRTARVWDAKTGKALTPPLEHKTVVGGAFWSRDGQRLNTITKDDYLQVWDLASGEPLTPPRKLQEQLPDSLPLASKMAEELPSDNRPATDLVLLARMLAVGRIDAGGNVVPLQLHELTEAWETLQAKYPRQFMASAPEIASWHHRQARESEIEGNPAAAQFHRALEKLHTDPITARHKLHVESLAQGLPLRTDDPATHAADTHGFPSRDPTATGEQIDLSAHYNLHLHRPGGWDFGNLPEGIQVLGGTKFDLRGLVHVYGEQAKQDGSEYPTSVKGIRVGRACGHLHFLQGTAYGAPPGTIVGKYVLHYSDDQERELQVKLGRDTGPWLFPGLPPAPKAPGGAIPVWVGKNLQGARIGCSICLYMSTRDNPRPDAEITSIDFVSTRSSASPFLAALTVK